MQTSTRELDESDQGVRVQQIGRSPALECGLRIFSCLTERGLARGRCCAGDVRGQQQARRTEQFGTDGWLPFENIQCRRTDVPRMQRCREGPLVDDASATDVHQGHTRLHRGNLRCANEVLCLGR